MSASSTLVIAVVLSIQVFSGLAEPEITKTYCGGVLNVGLDSPAKISYKLNEEYGNNEQCVWTVRVDGEGANALRFIKKESNFELRYDFIQLSSFRRDNLLLPSETRTLGNVHEPEEVTMTAPIVFVTFSTDDSNTGTGFELEIEAVAGTGYNYVKMDFFSDEPVGNTTLKPYFKQMFASYIITANNVDSLELGIHFDTEAFADIISVFHLERNGGRILFFPYGLLSGSGTRYYTLRSYTTFALLFSSDNYSNGDREGFDLDWKQGKDTGTEKPPMDW